MGTELPTKVMLGQTLVLIQMTFLNNVRKVGTLVLSTASCIFMVYLNTLLLVQTAQRRMIRRLMNIGLERI
jgi:hypothetical protein